MITIIGAGLAGMSAARHLKEEYVLLEKEKSCGGLCRSASVNGHTTDIGGGHIIYTNDSHAKNLFEQLLGNNLLWHERESYIFLKNVYVKYPFEVNLHGLPKKVVEECIEGVENKKTGRAKNFDQWILNAFGRGIAKHYMRPYNRKLWKYDLKKMSTDWLGDRVPSPNVDDMKKGAEKSISKKFGGNAFFHYPVKGGIQSLSDSLSKGLNISFESGVEEINARNLAVTYKKSGSMKTLKAEKILSSMPLPELIKIIDDVPSDVEKASRELIYNSIICLALSVNRQKISDKHWIYYPEKGIVFNRIIITSNLSPSMSPKNESSLIIENTYKSSEKIGMEKRKAEILDDLEKTGIIKKGDEVNILNVSTPKYAYVVYDLNHRKNVNIIHGFLNSIGIVPIGRFGKWEYLNMDKAILDGKKEAERL